MPRPGSPGRQRKTKRRTATSKKHSKQPLYLQSALRGILPIPATPNLDRQSLSPSKQPVISECNSNRTRFTGSRGISSPLRFAMIAGLSSPSTRSEIGFLSNQARFRNRPDHLSKRSETDSVQRPYRPRRHREGGPAECAPPGSPAQGSGREDHF